MLPLGTGSQSHDFAKGFESQGGVEISRQVGWPIRRKFSSVFSSHSGPVSELGPVIKKWLFTARQVGYGVAVYVKAAKCWNKDEMALRLHRVRSIRDEVMSCACNICLLLVCGLQGPRASTQGLRISFWAEKQRCDTQDTVQKVPQVHGHCKEFRLNSKNLISRILGVFVGTLLW